MDVAAAVRAVIRLQNGKQRPEVMSVVAPASDRAGVERLPHLPVAYRGNGSFGTMEVETSWLPLQSKKRGQSPGFALEIGDQRLIIDLDQVLRTQPLPILSQATDRQAAMAAVLQLVGKLLRAVAEQLKKTGESDVSRVAAAIDHARAGKQAPDRADMKDVVGHFVDHPHSVAAEFAQSRDVRGRGATVGVKGFIAVAMHVRQRLQQSRNGSKLAGPEYLRMAGADLLDESGARARHPHNEHRQLGQVADPRSGGVDVLGGEGRDRFGDGRLGHGFRGVLTRRWRSLADEGVCGGIMGERFVKTAGVV